MKLHVPTRSSHANLVGALVVLAVLLGALLLH
jgi:hypothetical protein